MKSKDARATLPATLPDDPTPQSKYITGKKKAKGKDHESHALKSRGKNR